MAPITQQTINDVRVLIAPHRASADPPFSGLQMLVLLVVLAGGQATFREIIDLVQHEFAVFHRNAVGKYTHPLFATERYIDMFDSPLTRKRCRKVESIWQVDDHLARQFLDLNNPPRLRRFRLLDLPIGIRKLIFSMVLNLSPYMIWIHESFDPSNVFVGLPTHKNTDSWLGHSTQRDGQSILNIHDFLALFFVSKQIYNEAKEVFYGKNTFYFEDPFLMREFLTILPQDRLVHVTRLALTFGDYPISAADNIAFDDALEEVSRLPNVQELTLDLLWGIPECGHDWTVPAFSKLSGFRHLVTMRDVKKVVITTGRISHRHWPSEMQRQVLRENLVRIMKSPRLEEMVDEDEGDLIAWMRWADGLFQEA